MSNIIIVIIIISIVLAVFEAIARTTEIPKTILRKIVHVGMSLAVICASQLVAQSTFISLGIGFALLLYLLRRTHPLQSLSDRSESSYGDIFFPLGVSGAAFFASSSSEFVATILILGFADTMAYFVGRHIRSPQLLHTKTLAGSSAFFIATILLCLFVTPIVGACVVAVGTTLVELASPRGSDNLTIPIAASVLLSCF